MKSELTRSVCAKKVAKSADIVQDLLGAAWDDFGERSWEATGLDIADFEADIWGTEPLPQPDGQVTQWLEFWGRPQGFDSQTILRES